MIDNNYDLLIGLYLGIIFFFAGYYFIGTDRQSYMPGSSLNYIFITFFIVLFFLFGYLFKNIIIGVFENRMRNKVPTVAKV